MSINIFLFNTILFYPVARVQLYNFYNKTVPFRTLHSHENIQKTITMPLTNPQTSHNNQTIKPFIWQSLNPMHLLAASEFASLPLSIHISIMYMHHTHPYNIRNSSSSSSTSKKKNLSRHFIVNQEPNHKRTVSEVFFSHSFISLHFASRQQ